MEPNYFIDILVTNFVPFAAFFFGVTIAHISGLYPKLERKFIWITSVPTALIITGMLISSASTELNGITYHGYMDSLAKYFIFIGTIIFYGTAAPELFSSFRGRFKGTVNNG